MHSRVVVALHGLQGSGKTTLANEILSRPWTRCGEPEKAFLKSIKDGFKKYATHIIDDVGLLLPDSSLSLATKELQRAISTWGERFEPQIWSSLYAEQVRCVESGLVVTDDIRTEMNLKALELLSVDSQILLVYLYCDEETRKNRVSVWREVNDYTEQMLRPHPWLHTLSIDTGVLGRYETMDLVTAELEKMGWQ